MFFLATEVKNVKVLRDAEEMSQYQYLKDSSYKVFRPWLPSKAGGTALDSISRLLVLDTTGKGTALT